jgi:hypothetical protein
MQVMTMISATQFRANFRHFPKRLLLVFLSITERRQRRRLLIWDPQTLSPVDVCVSSEEPVAQ